MKTLPKYWAVKTDTSHPLWEKFYNWFENQSWNSRWNDAFEYFGFDGIEYSVWDDLLERLKIITLEEWNECINGTKESITYKIQYIGSDWTLLEKDSINGKPLKEFKEEYNRMRRLLRKHKECFKS